MSSVEATPAGVISNIRKTALNAVNRQMGAKMVEFNGWDMPVEYPASIGCGIINEHMAVRTGVGIFDVSHMGEFMLKGPNALDLIQRVTTNGRIDIAGRVTKKGEYSIGCVASADFAQKGSSPDGSVAAVFDSVLTAVHITTGLCSSSGCHSRDYHSSLLRGKGSIGAVPGADTVGSYNSKMISSIPS